MNIEKLGEVEGEYGDVVTVSLWSDRSIYVEINADKEDGDFARLEGDQAGQLIALLQTAITKKIRMESK